MKIECRQCTNRFINVHKGCAFVTYDNADSAELAIETLHNKQTLPGMTSPIQVKYAHGGGGDAPRYTPGTNLSTFWMLHYRSLISFLQQPPCPITECPVWIT